MRLYLGKWHMRHLMQMAYVQIPLCREALHCLFDVIPGIAGRSDSRNDVAQSVGKQYIHNID